MQIDVYDFDKTMLPFDSALRYWGFCMVHCPWILVFLPAQVFWGMLLGLKIISVQTCKKVAFLYINFIDNEKMVKKYWDKYESKIYDWCRAEQRPRVSAIVSASPDFLISEIANRLGVEYCICSKFDKHGVMQGRVCRREEKAARVALELKDVEIMDVYTDSVKADKWLLDLGHHRFLVTKGVANEMKD